jgi:hypothetical protein
LAYSSRVNAKAHIVFGKDGELRIFDDSDENVIKQTVSIVKGSLGTAVYSAFLRGLAGNKLL